jgi:hypothetical protein
MKRISLITIALAAAAVIGGAQADNAPITPVKDQRALSGLKEMSDALTALHSMSFDTTSITPFRGPNGQWIHVLKTAQVKMQRPNRLFVQTGGDAVKQDVYFDGKNYSIYAKDHQLFSKEEITGSIDDMLSKASSQGGDSFPFEDVLLSDPYASWTKDLDGAVYVGESDRQGEKLSHFAMTAKGVDWEVFVDQKTHLPRIVYVKYTDLERSPSTLIEFSKWKLNPKLAASTFTFKAPEGAKKAQFKAPKGAK